MCLALLLTLMLCCITCCHSACSYPSNLVGDWYSTSFGTLTFTSTSFSGFTSALDVTPLTFTCELASGSKYVSKSSTQLFSGVTVDVYLCMNLRQLSAVKYFFTLDSNLDSGTGIRFYTSAATDVTISDVCRVTDTRSAGEYELLIKQANVMDTFISCPSELQSLFDVTMTTQSVTNCNGNNLDGRTSTALNFNFSSCATGRFNVGSYLSCVYVVYSGFIFVTTYNNDTSVDGSSTFRFTCFAISKVDATIYATESPGSCDLGQSSTTVGSPGIRYVMTDLLYVPDEDHTVLIAVLCSVGGFLIIVVIAVIVYIKVFRKPKPAPPPKTRKRKRKPSITEYTPRLTRSESVEKDIGVKKKTAGEILTGTLTDKKDAVLDGGGYEPPPREVWRKKWETEMRPATPTSKSGMSPSDVNPGLHKNAKTTSLPDNLDKPSQSHTSKDSMGDETMSLEDVRYSERAHAFSKIPESNGKFGISPRQKLQDSLLSGLDTNLDTIKENPLSRENTALKLPPSLREQTIKSRDVGSSTRTDTKSLLSTTLTASTLSARDVHITPQSNLSRSSRLSQSNASVFDDPTWLNENNKKPNTFFDVLKNLLPGLPQKKVQDQNWFLKSGKKPEITREDIEYFKTRNSRSVGISSLAGKRSLSSKSIIENENKRRGNKKRTTTIKPKIDWQYKWERFLRPKSPFTDFFRRRTKIRDIKSAPPGIVTTQISRDLTRVDCDDSFGLPGSAGTHISNRKEKTNEDITNADRISLDSYEGIPSSFHKTGDVVGWQETQSLNLECSKEYRLNRKRDFDEAFRKDKATKPGNGAMGTVENGIATEESQYVNGLTEFAVIDETAGPSAESLSAASDTSIEQYIIRCLTQSQTSCDIQPGLFYPEDWILGIEEDRKSADILKRGSKFLSKSHNRETKQDVKDWFSSEWGIGLKR